jgi:hypothetical protein
MAFTSGRHLTSLSSPLLTNLLTVALLWALHANPVVPAARTLLAQDPVGETPTNDPAVDAPVPGGSEGSERREGRPLASEPSIPPGREELLGAMLGRDTTLAEGCSWAGGDVDRTLIRSKYQCKTGDVVVELSHPSKAPAGTVQTERFAVTLLSGSPPPQLMDALVARIRAREAEFEWIGTIPKGRRFSSFLVPIAGSLLALLAARWVWQKWRRRG